MNAPSPGEGRVSEHARFYPFRPSLNGPFAARFAEATGKLCASPKSFEQLALDECEWARVHARLNIRQRRAYRAIWLVLRDLLRVGWAPRLEAGVFEIAPPNHEAKLELESRDDFKGRIRAMMGPARLSKLLEAREFILRMEKPSKNGTPRLPISSLIADGEHLANDLAALLDLPQPEIEAKLEHVVSPYLQLVSEGARCEFTGHRLGDIWRYFRFYWATPPENTPGRTLLYLVRDAARPNHPIIGIASLENSPLRLSARDDYLGWTKESFYDEVLSEHATPASVRTSFERLLLLLDTAIGEIDLQDLCSEEDCAAPTEEAIARLSDIVTVSNQEKGDALKRWRERGDSGEDDDTIVKSELGDVSVEFEDALYRRKRADALGRWLTAKRAITSLLNSPDYDAAWPGFIQAESGQAAIWAALVALKNRHVGTSILELNVCGAVPPYNDLLGGKLVALLALSPEVVCDYRDRYGSRPSDIASRMKGSDVVRPAELVFLGTTSLFKGGSSQYNRLLLPKGLFGPESPEVRWRLLKNNRHPRGETRGYGTLHISRSTLMALDEATDITSVNHAFGEGASPKLRMIRFALERLLDPGQRQIIDEITRHAMSRVVYGAVLANNGLSVLRSTNEVPQFPFGQVEPREGSRRIVSYWTTRWLGTRIRFAPALDRVRQAKAEELVLGKELERGGEEDYVPITDEEGGEMSVPTGAGQWREFVRLLHKGTSAYADRTGQGFLEAMHVATELDNVIVDCVAAGSDVILTGNPGDGKTHLLRVLESRLMATGCNPKLLLDASALSDRIVIETWQEARASGRPFCAAINEAVLFTLAKESEFEPLRVAIAAVKGSIVYADSNEEPIPSVAVFDLSRRNVLDSSIVNPVVEKLINPDRLTQCILCDGNCDAMRAAAYLRDSQVRARLQLLFERVAAIGNHFTLRELQAFFAYLLFASRDCGALVSTSGSDEFAFPNLVFSGDGRLSQELARICDPRRSTQPALDEEQILAPTSPEGWSSLWHADSSALDPSNDARFTIRKRAFYFFHDQGARVFEFSSSDELGFAELLAKREQEIFRHIIKRVNALFGDGGEQEYLWAWQSHRYDQGTPSVFFASTKLARSKLEIARPRLHGIQARAFKPVVDHVLLRVKQTPEVSLRIDFAMFRLLELASRGVPVLSLPSQEMRRLNHFLERLSRSLPADEMDEILVRVKDLANAESLDVRLAATSGSEKYLSVQSKGGLLAD